MSGAAARERFDAQTVGRSGEVQKSECSADGRDDAVRCALRPVSVRNVSELRPRRYHARLSLPERALLQGLTAARCGGHTAQKYRCTDCHTISGEGGTYGPDLTRAWQRYF